MKNQFVCICKCVSLLLCVTLLFPAVLQAERFTEIDSMYYWFSNQQTPEGVVIAENKDNFTIEEEVFSSLVFLRRGHVNRAERILNYFYALQKKLSEQGKFNGFYRYYQLNGEPLSSEILSGTQLWLLMALNEYSLQTGSTKFKPFAKVLADVVLDMEGPEYGVCAGWWGTTPLTYFNASDNILACSVFPKLWKWTEESKYRFAAWREYRFLTRFLWNDTKKCFRRKTFSDEYDLTDNYFATLTFGGSYQGWNTLADPTDLYNKTLQALVYSMYEKKNEDKTLLSNIIKEVIWSKKNIGSCGLPAVEGGTDIDIFTTAWYLLSIDGYNPFYVEALFWKNKVLLPPAERQFTGDDFESGKMKTVLAYPVELINTNQCQVSIDWDNENIRNGKGSLRIFFSPQVDAKAPHASIGRRFLDSQDFSTFSNCKVWVKLVTSVRTSEKSIRLCMGIIDSDGELWESPEFTVIGTKGFYNSFPFPNGWKRSAVSAKGNNIFDIERVSEMRFIIDENSDVPWQVFIDDLTFQ